MWLKKSNGTRSVLKPFGDSDIALKFTQVASPFVITVEPVFKHKLTVKLLAHKHSITIIKLLKTKFN